jgi:hypothetical protein
VKGAGFPERRRQQAINVLQDGEEFRHTGAVYRKTPMRQASGQGAGKPLASRE